jgi:hypothetical protein
VHLHTALGGLGDAVQDCHVDVLGVLDIEAVLGRVDELRHVIARIGVAPQQTLVGARLPIVLRPVGLEHLDDLPDMLRLMGDDP